MEALPESENLKINARLKRLAVKILDEAKRFVSGVGCVDENHLVKELVTLEASLFQGEVQLMADEIAKFQRRLQVMVEAIAKDQDRARAVVEVFGLI